MTDGPLLWLLAGPNGAGKSTYAPVPSSDVEETVRPDELAYGLSPSAPENAALGAGRLAIGRIEKLLEERRSFAVETTLSGHIILILRDAPKTLVGTWEFFIWGFVARDLRLNAFDYESSWAAITCQSLTFAGVTLGASETSLHSGRPPTESSYWTTPQPVNRSSGSSTCARVRMFSGDGAFPSG